jgi:hypothetical protein
MSLGSHLKLTRLQREILKKLKEMQENNGVMTVDYSDFALELARELSERKTRWSSERNDSSIWVTPQATRIEYKRLFHSTKESKLFKVSLNKSLNQLEKMGYVRVHVADESMREYPSQKRLAITKRGIKEIANK